MLDTDGTPVTFMDPDKYAAENLITYERRIETYWYYRYLSRTDLCWRKDKVRIGMDPNLSIRLCSNHILILTENFIRSYLKLSRLRNISITTW